MRIEGTPKEFADLVLAIQGQQSADIKLLVDGVEISRCPQGNHG